MATNAQKTTLHIAGSSGTPATLTAVTPGFPTIIAMTGHTGLVNGDVVAFALFAGADAALLNGQTAVVQDVATGATNDTFSVRINTVGKTITIGTATATPSAWVKVGNITGIKGTSDTAPDNKITTLDDDSECYQPGLPDTGNVTLECQINDSDTGLAAIEAAFDARAVKAFKITYPTGVTPVRTFNGYAKSFPKIGDAPLGGILTGSIELKRSGTVTKS